jgi:hypothetical protein
VIHVRISTDLSRGISTKHREKGSFYHYHTIGKFVLDILGRDKASETTAVILGWISLLDLSFGT